MKNKKTNYLKMLTSRFSGPRSALLLRVSSSRQTNASKQDEAPSGLSLNMRAISDSGMFDKDYYLKKYKDVRIAGVDPLQHFTDYGGREYRNPSEYFDSAFYAYKNDLYKNKNTHLLLDYIEKNKNNILDKEKYSMSEAKKHQSQIEKEIVTAASKFSNAIVVESMSWQGSLQQRPHHIARLLSERGVMVVYLDCSAALVEKVGENIYVVNNQKFLKKFSKAKVAKKYFWLFSTTPVKNTKLNKLKLDGYEVIYDYIDDFDEAISLDISIQLESYKNLESINPLILIASADRLHSQLEKRFPKRKILLCQNAVDQTHFDYGQAEREDETPADMINVVSAGKPIVGYYGAIAPWLDYAMLNKLTKKRQDLEFVFIGIDYNGGLKHLELRENVRFLGAKDYHNLAKYSHLFDCAIIPFKKGDIAKSTSPVKLFEYMAMALPTVCTRDLYECRGYDYVYMSKTDADFEKNIDIAIREKKNEAARKKLIEQASENTWAARVDTIVNELKAQKKE